MTLRFLPRAEADLDEGIAYYAAIRADLGERFERAISDTLRRLAAHPERGAPRSTNIRRWLVRGFPYSVRYAVEPTGIVIVAVAHHRKGPPEA